MMMNVLASLNIGVIAGYGSNDCPASHRCWPHGICYDIRPDKEIECICQTGWMMPNCDERELANFYFTELVLHLTTTFSRRQEATWLMGGLSYYDKESTILLIGNPRL